MDLIGHRTVPALLQERAERDPDKLALVFDNLAGVVVEFTYADLAIEASRVAGGLARLGVEPGDRVVAHLPNGPEIVLLMFAAAHLGAVIVPSNTANTARELEYVCSRSDAVVAVTSPEHVDTLDAVRAQVPLRHVVTTGSTSDDGWIVFDTLRAAAPVEPERSISPLTTMEILFTSGTTTEPKGVELTHANWLWSGERSSRTLRLDERDRLLTALPLFHVNAQSITLMNAMTLGATAIVLAQFSASRFMERVVTHQATHTSLVAMFVRTLLAQPTSDAESEHQLRRVSYAINVTDAAKQAFEDRFGVELINGYGLSEAMTEVTVCPVNGPKRWPSIGLPVLDREVRIVGPQGDELPVGGIGEITVRGVPGRTIMKGYLNDANATAEAIRDGWLHTGDNGFFDEHGYLYFFDRAKDIIKRAGENISASEVEAALAEHPAVELAAVIGVPDPIRDEAVHAFVVAAAGVDVTPDELRRHCSERLAAFKVPSTIEIRDKLPLTSIGKIEKRALRSEQLAAR